MTGYDAIVVGGGHHGLTCAAYLAREGKRVVVLERRPWLGGMTYSQQTVPEAPGFEMNPCAVDLLFTNLKPSIIDELQLERHGLRQAAPDPWGSWLGQDGESIGLWRSLDRTVEEIARYSRRDAEKFAVLCEQWCDFWRIATPYLMDHPTRPRAKTLSEIGWRVLRARRNLGPIVRMLLASPEEAIETTFESDAVKTMLAVYASGSLAPMKEPGSGAVLGMAMLHIGWGIKRPVGGMQSFTESLAQAVRSHGGEIRTDVAVAEIVVSGGRASGVRLANGDTLRARHVIGAVDPVTLVNKLVDPAHVSKEVVREVAAIKSNGWGIGSAKIDVALAERPRLLCDRPELWGSYMLVSDGGKAGMERAQYSSIHGELPGETPMWALMPSAVDRTQVPAGSTGDTMYLFCTAVPDRFADGSPWSDRVDQLNKQAVGLMESYAPGFSDHVVGAWAKTPDVMRDMNHGGSFSTVDMSLNQLGPNRPCPSLSGYRTPVEGLWHTGAGAHPMAGVHGWAGRTTARTILRREPRS